MKSEREKPTISGLGKNRKIIRMRRKSLRGKYFLSIFGLLATPANAQVKFTLGSTSSKVEQVADFDNYYYDTWEITQCGDYWSNYGYLESEHPFLPHTSCMYNVTASEDLEIRLPIVQLHVTERCVKDNVQIYVGSSLLDWICEEKNSFNDWVKLGSNQFGVYFEGLVLYKKRKNKNSLVYILSI